MITDIGSESVILGIDWLRFHNPEIDWNAGKFSLSRCPIKCFAKAKKKPAKAKKEVVEEELPPLLPIEEDDDEDLDQVINGMFTKEHSRGVSMEE
ncbi:hypothetical protein AZE42_12842, partial [Rhizopogon vesiculosus]